MNVSFKSTVAVYGLAEEKLKLADCSAPDCPKLPLRKLPEVSATMYPTVKFCLGLMSAVIVKIALAPARIPVGFATVSTGTSSSITVTEPSSSDELTVYPASVAGVSNSTSIVPFASSVLFELVRIRNSAM